MRKASGHTALPFQRGVNLTAEGRDGYSARIVRPTLRKLKEKGVNSVALVPYAFTRPGEPGVRFGMGWEKDERIRETAASARELGMSVFLKPQVWCPGFFTGDLTFSGTALDKWFSEYRAYILHQARLAESIRASLFCVGVEFGRLSRHAERWSGLIGEVRRIYPGPVTYSAAQGPEFENLLFWSELDYIGLNQYYPLADDLSAAHIVRKVETVQQRFRKPVIFTEAGFSSYEKPHRQPWDETARKLSPADQAACYESVLRAFYGKPWLAGIFWWKVGTNGYGGPQDGSHTPWGKPAMEVVARYYRSSAR